MGTTISNTHQSQANINRLRQGRILSKLFEICKKNGYKESYVVFTGYLNKFTLGEVLQKITDNGFTGGPNTFYTAVDTAIDFGDQKG